MKCKVCNSCLEFVRIGRNFYSYCHLCKIARIKAVNGWELVTEDDVHIVQGEINRLVEAGVIDKW